MGETRRKKKIGLFIDEEDGKERRLYPEDREEPERPGETPKPRQPGAQFPGVVHEASPFIGPDQGRPFGEPTLPGSPYCPSGVVVALAGAWVRGAPGPVYAVGLDGSLWKWNQDPKIPWQQLAGSPAGARWVAIDPLDAEHLIIGTRDGLAQPIELNDGGIWESPDGGESWTYLFNPLAWAGGARASQNISCTLMTKKGTLLFGTAYGLGRMERPFRPGAADLVLPSTSIRGLASNQQDLKGNERLWALSNQGPYEGTADGAVWPQLPVPLPTTVIDPDYFGTKLQVRMGPVNVLDSSVTQPIAAYGDRVAVYVTAPVLAPPRGGGGDRIALLELEVVIPSRAKLVVWDGKTWSPRILPVDQDSGPWKYLRSFTYYRQDPPDLKSPDPPVDRQVSGGAGGTTAVTHVLCGAGSQLAVMTAVTTPGGATSEGPWIPYTSNHNAAADVLVLNKPYRSFVHPQEVHSDFWDAYVEPDNTVWISSDGGISRKTTADPKIVEWNSGLATHLVSALVLGPYDPKTQSRITYTTQDNHVWATLDAKQWRVARAAGVGGGGDFGYGLGDPGSSAVFVGPYATPGWLMDYGATASTPVDVITQPGWNGRQLVRALQRPSSENPATSLDLVLVVSADPNLSFVDDKGKIQLVRMVSPQYQTALKSGSPKILRCRKFGGSAASWDLAWQAVLKGSPPPWEVENLWGGLNLSFLTMGLWVAGGVQAVPTYYSVDNPIGNSGIVYRWARSELDAGFSPLGAKALLNPGGSRDALFVDPWSDEHLLVFSTTGVLRSTDYGASFAQEQVLQALITGSGRYPYTDSFFGYPGWGYLGTIPRNTLSGIAFHPREKYSLAAASAMGEVFYRGGDGRWRNLSSRIADPPTFISRLAIDETGIYVGSYGRGLLRLTGYRSAQFATYFAPPGGGDSPAVVATLRDDRQSPVAGAFVFLQVRATDGVYLPDGKSEFVGSTGAKGEIAFPLIVLSEQPYVVHITYRGESTLGGRVVGNAPARGSFLFKRIASGPSRFAPPPQEDPKQDRGSPEAQLAAVPTPFYDRDSARQAESAFLRQPLNARGPDGDPMSGPTNEFDRHGGRR